jgi:peptide/nickel transport system permease protein
MTTPRAGAETLVAPGASRPADAMRLQRTLLQRLLSHPLAMASAAVLLAVTLLVLATPLVENSLGIDSDTQDLLARMQPPSASHWLGTDELGRDLLLRLLEGGRVSLGIGLVVALAAGVIGTVIGLIAGYVGGSTDAVLMRITDGIIALPRLPLLIVLAALDVTKLGVPDAWAHSPMLAFWRIAIIITLVGWTTVARLVRGAALSLREREFVRAARALGARPTRVMFVHILPNLAGSIVVATTLSVGSIILLESVLSFLGLGIQPPMASWGNMLTNAQEMIWSAPMLAVWPGLLIFVSVICCNFLGDGLQDALDPRS